MVKRYAYLLPKFETQSEEERGDYKSATLEEQKQFYISQILIARNDKELLSSLGAALGVEAKRLALNGIDVTGGLIVEVEITDELNQQAFKNTGL